jgi:glycosyltransferase involved in cell wall biosynthesis
VATAHGAVAGMYGGLLARSAPASLVAISSSQRASAPHLDRHGVVRNGVTVQGYPVGRTKQDHLLFLGRMHPDKGVLQAIEVAERSGAPLLVAARMHGNEEESYFRDIVRPRLSSSIEYVGELPFADKVSLLGTARALLFPLQWEEPYGLVVAEAQACGTPVLSPPRRRPGLVLEGVTAFLADHHLELVDAVDQVGDLSPDACRAFALQQLDIARAVAGYERVFDEVGDARRRTRIPQARLTLLDLREGDRMTTTGGAP